MNLETEEISEMVVEGAGGGIHFKEHKQETRESSISAEETVFDIADGGILDPSNCIVNKESNDELKNGVFAGSDTNVDSRENVGEVGNQEKETSNDEHEKEEQITGSVDMQKNGAGLASEEGVNEMFTVSEDNVREETVMGNLSNEDTGEEKDLESLTVAVALNEKEEIIDDDTNTAKEELLVSKKKVLKPKKVVKKRKLVKGKVLAKNEEEPQSLEMHVSSVEERTNENVKNEENPDSNPMDNINSSLTDVATLNEKVEIRNDDTITTKEAPSVPNNKVLKPKKVVKKVVVKKKKLVKRKVVAKDEEEPQSSEMHESSGEVQTNQNVENEENPDAKPMDDVKSSLTDAVTLNEKEEIINDDTNTTKEVVLVPNNKVLKPKKVVKKVIKKVVKRRRLVKGIVVAKDDEKPQSSEIPDPSVDVRTNQNVKNQENPDAKPMDNVNNSSTVRTKKKNARQITDEVSVKSKQSEKGEQAGKGKEASKTENMDNMKEEAKSKSSKISSRKAEKSSLIEVPAEHNDEAGPSEKHKSSNEVETMGGMIFMCSSKTKEDCYRYKLFGLPASKKDVVLKIYKGMKLFLFDFKLKLLYGIYEAAGPGGYNIEPNAFHSNFPSQVRFTTVHECSPLLEAKFKKVIKDNYYTKNKFKCELNSKQVTSLCELFRVDKKATLSKAKAATDRPKVGMGIRPIVEREKKRKATVENEVNRGREKRKAVVDSERDIKRRRVVDDVKRSKVNRDVRPTRVNRDVRPPRVNRDVRPPRVNLDVRRPRAEDNRRQRLEDNARRSRAEDDSRRLRLEADARRLRLDDDARRSRLENDARRLRAENDARRLRAENDARRILDEDRRRILDEDRRHSRLADVYEREAYLPSSALPAPLHLDALPPPAVPTYTLSYDYGRASNLSEDRALSYSGSRLLSDYERSRDPYFPYREPVEYRDQEYTLGNRRVYSPIAPRGEYPPSTSRLSGYRVSPYRRH